MSSLNWKQLLKRMKLKWMKQNHPDFFAQSGGYSMQIKPWTDSTANGLTAAIQDFVKYQGGYSNRVNSMGLMRKVRGEMKWTRGLGNVGAADLRILFKGRSIDTEIKIKKDVQSDAQHKEKARIEKAGGVYIVAKSFPDFLEQWQALGFELPMLLYQ